MKLETLKTIVLVGLIMLSLLLTLAIWRYQPDYEYADSGRRVIDANLGGGEETKKSIIQPSQILFHLDGNISGLEDKSKEDQLFSLMQNWSLYDFGPTGQVNESMNENKNDVIEVIFPTQIPTSIIQDLFSIDEDSIVPDRSFNRMYIYLEQDRTNDQVLFENTENGFNISANIQNMTEVRKDLFAYKDNHAFEPYITFKNSNQIPIYLPETAEMFKRPFSFKTIAIAPLRNVLFNNPSAVRSSAYTNGSQLYTDGSRAMVIHDNHIEYTNPTPSESKLVDGRQLLSQTLDFINAHGGWTTDVYDQFQLYDVDLQTNVVRYQLTYGGYPVFENSDLSTISVTMRNQSVYQYIRPIVQLKDTFGDGQQEDLKTGMEVISILNQSKAYQSRAILDVALGYKIEENQGGQIFMLTPTWYVKDYGGWKELIDQESTSRIGGEAYAMGSN